MTNEEKKDEAQEETTSTRGRSRAAAPEKEYLLTCEAHPILGTTERWLMSDGTVQEVTTAPRPEVGTRP